MSNPRPERRTGDQLAEELAPPETLKRIITEDTTESIRVLTETAERIGEALADRKLSASQIRSIFGMVRTIDQETKMLDDQQSLPIPAQRELQMLRPKLAYQYGRVQDREKAKKEAMGALAKILSDSISLVGADIRRFRNFVDFFEAILAYHRRYGGSNN